MIYYNLFVYLTVIFINLWITHTLHVEYIKGGFLANEKNYRYHASILGKSNYTNFVYLICGAAIIRQNFILSNAACFLKENNELKKFRFFIVPGTSNLTGTVDTKVWIEKIYVPRLDNTHRRFDISISKLMENLMFGPDSIYAKLNIPSVRTRCNGRTAILAGYEKNPEGHDFSLKYIFLRLQREEICMSIFSRTYQLMRGRAMTLANFSRETFDISSTDAGNPIVAGNTIVGLVSKRFSNVTPLGKLIVYTDICRIRMYINLAMQESLNSDSFITYYNRIHII